MRKFVSHYSDKIMTQDTIGRITADTTIDYGNLMRRRIRKVLLIGISYDAFTLEEDGRIDVQISNEYIDLNLSNPPSFRRVSSSVEALELLRDDPGFDLVISMFNVGEIDVFHLHNNKSFGAIAYIKNRRFMFSHKTSTPCIKEKSIVLS